MRITARPSTPGSSEFALGVDLGQAQDYTALAIVERAAALHLRHLERLPLGTPYPFVVEHVSELMQALPVRSALVVDAGGPGRPVVDAMRAADLQPVAVSITSGKRSRRANGMVYVPKRELVRGLVTAFENGRFKIAKGLLLADAFMDELRAFQVRLTAKGHDTYAARSGEYDDLVIAVALAVWGIPFIPESRAPSFNNNRLVPTYLL